MSLQEKLLKIIFVILIIVLLGEIGYLIYSNFNNKKINDISIKTSSQTPTLIDYKNFVVNRNQLKYLETLKWQDFDKNKLYYVVENEGYVKNLKEISPNRFSFDIYNENGEILAKDIRIPIIPTVPLSVYKIEDNNLYLSDISQLKENKKIKFQWRYDMTKDPDGSDLVDNILIIY